MDSISFANIIKSTFAGYEVFKSKDLVSLIETYYPAISEKTIAWKINQLKNDGFIFQVGRGLYSLRFLPEFEPKLSLKTKRFIGRIDKAKYPNMVVWDTAVFEYILNQSFDKFWIFILLPKQDLETLFADLQQLSKPVFLNPDLATITRYVLSQPESVILLPTISQMPSIQLTDYSTLSIETTLINTWIDYDRYFQAFELDLSSLFKLSFQQYNINRSKMLRYAARREKREIIEKYINELTL